MRATILLFAFVLSAGPALAQSVFDRAVGIYGSVQSPDTSCVANPHDLSFEPDLRHMNLRWQNPALDYGGQWTNQQRYDVLGHDDTSLTLRLEGDRRRTDTGARPTWILRLNDSPAGYCWARADWPLVRCVEPQVRCEDNAPLS